MGFESFLIWVDVQLVHPAASVCAQASLLLDKIAKRNYFNFQLEQEQRYMPQSS